MLFEQYYLPKHSKVPYAPWHNKILIQSNLTGSRCAQSPSPFSARHFPVCMCCYTRAACSLPFCGSYLATCCSLSGFYPLNCIFWFLHGLQAYGWCAVGIGTSSGGVNGVPLLAWGMQTHIFYVPSAGNEEIASAYVQDHLLVVFLSLTVGDSSSLRCWLICCLHCFLYSPEFMC